MSSQNLSSSINKTTAMNVASLLVKKEKQQKVRDSKEVTSLKFENLQPVLEALCNFCMAPSQNSRVVPRVYCQVQ